LIAEAENELIGTVMTGFDGHRGWIYYLATLPDRQHQGVARTLIAAAERWLVGHGCPKVELMVRSGNPAVEFYKRIGWEKQDVEVYARWLNNKDT
jgi:ribosomal protein S18 acetylase RimI-like enzyme